MEDPDPPLPLNESDWLRVTGQTVLGEDPSVARVTQLQLSAALALKTNVGTSNDLQAQIEAITLVADADRTSTSAYLSNKADKSNTYTKMEVDTVMSDKMNTADFNTLVHPLMSSWLTQYINTNPNSWVNLRTLLQYYPLTYSTWTSPTHEFVARSTDTNLRTWKKVTDTLYTTTLYNWYAGFNPEYTLLTETATLPYAFKKGNMLNGANLYSIYSSATNTWANKGSMFIVYSWVTAPETNRILATSLGNTNANGITVNATGPRCRWTRGEFAISLEAGGESVFTGPPVVDTAIDTPYIQGLSWDFTINPPRFCWVNQRYAVEHFGPNEPNETLEITESGLIPTPGTSWNLPYTAYHAAESRPATTSLFGLTQTGSTSMCFHYIGKWTSYMDMEQMRTVHMRLLQRYCVPPYPATNYLLADTVP